MDENQPPFSLSITYMNLLRRTLKPLLNWDVLWSGLRLLKKMPLWSTLFAAWNPNSRQLRIKYLCRATAPQRSFHTRLSLLGQTPSNTPTGTMPPLRLCFVESFKFIHHCIIISEAGCPPLFYEHFIIVILTLMTKTQNTINLLEKLNWLKYIQDWLISLCTFFVFSLYFVN